MLIPVILSIPNQSLNIVYNSKNVCTRNHYLYIAQGHDFFLFCYPYRDQHKFDYILFRHSERSKRVEGEKDIGKRGMVEVVVRRRRHVPLGRGVHTR